MKKKRKRKLTEVEEKQVDYFTERLVDILITQVEQEALVEQDPDSKNEKKQNN